MGAITKEERLRREALAQNGIKVCSHCKRELEFSCFCNDKTQKDGLSNMCRECRSINNRIYEQKHNEDRKEYKRQYRKDNKEYLSEYNKAYNQKHKFEIVEQRRQYRLQHRIERNEATNMWRKNNLDKIQEYNQSDRVKKMKKSYWQKRRALVLNTEGSYTGNDVEDLLIFFDNKCAYTGEPLEESFHLDHIIPLVNGGTNYIWNIVPSNPSPNLSKSSRDMETWFRDQEYFSEYRLDKIKQWIFLKKEDKSKEIQNNE